ncbi:GDSL-type esterase/lipase family protein [Vibrio thalassae]|uniref:GDSL-type esterase/lipase family protein n=1 Tax=Vibrio thalassae TaxID=1243014 RepID=UPI001305074C|nr:GDSL-type esterase/lipase family protein [Vibrio thalassae]
MRNIREKIVLMGDSLTAGWGLAATQNWSDKLSQAHPNLEFINCGVPGDTTTGMLARFKQQVVDRNPKFVVIFGGLNDLNWGTDINVIAEQSQCHDCAVSVSWHPTDSSSDISRRSYWLVTNAKSQRKSC